MKYALLVTALLCFLIGALCLLPGYLMTDPEPSQPSDPTASVTPTPSPTEPPTNAPTDPPTEPPTEAPTEPPVVKENTVTLGATGDILLHDNVIKSGKKADGTYDFNYIFQHLLGYINGLDYMVGNMEGTLAGDDNGYPYRGYPQFNAPDAIGEAAKNAGFDMLLTANNHSYDTSSVGMHRTIEIIRDRELDHIGFVDAEEEKRYLVKEINGINIGMICYTYETDNRADVVALNGLPLKAADKNLVNAFDYNALDTFYAELEGYLADMEADGAEATMLYIHWGDEYQLKQNANQSKIAQKICDLGVDVIVGGHPHVVQPMDLLESTVDPDHKTVCLYSMGNAVSNQRQGNLTAISTAHTEDGVLFSVTFSKYSDGTVYVESTDLLPVWVYRRSDGTGNEYNMLPLHIDEADGWMEDFNMKEHTVTAAKNSHARTMAIVQEGLTECQTYLQESYEAREQYYYDLAFNPEKFATEATEAPTEAATEATAAVN